MEHTADPTAERYLEHLSDGDLDLLGAASGLTGHLAAGEAAAHLRSHPSRVLEALTAPSSFEQLFGPSARAGGDQPQTSPFLLFAVAVHRGVDDLNHATFIAERVGAHKRIPVFDTASLRRYYTDPHRRLLAVEHLASYTRVQSGPVWVKQGRRWRRHRYSELEPVRLAGLLDLVTDAEKPGVYRRLGDLALFLTGVFPDHSARPLHPVESERLVRSLSGISAAPLDAGDVSCLLSGTGATRDGLLRVLGPRWYRAAADASPLPPVQRLLRDAADGFDLARRFLNHLTDHYLFPLRDGWFGAAAS